MADGSSTSQRLSSVRPAPAPAPAREHDSVSIFSGLRLVGLLTLGSRVLGLVRDVAMAALFGNGPVMDAFSVAFRIPNLARQLFGEGALTAAFLPLFVREMEHSGAQVAWKLASAVLTVLAMSLAAIVIVAELVLWAAATIAPISRETDLLIGLTAVMLPYLVLICLASQIGAVLQAFGRFAWPAFSPVLLNMIWIGCLWLVAPWFESPVERIYTVAFCILLAGIVQLAAPIWTLKRLGFHYKAAWRSSSAKVAEIARTMAPIIVGLSITQLNTLADSLIAWGFSRPESGALTMNLPGHPEYPLPAGTASALYFAQRMYQLPLGIFGVALGTVLFPLFARHAGRARVDLLRDDLSQGLRLVMAVGFPASLGLVLLAHPLTVLLFQHGQFDDDATRQTAGMIEAYSFAVWAYCGLLIVHRAYYAVGDRITPLRIGMVAVALNLVLNFTLIWFLGGRGLALATAVSAIVQIVLVIRLLERRIGPLNWRALGVTCAKALLATAAMGIACVTMRDAFSSPQAGAGRAWNVVVPLAVSVVTFLAVARLIGLREPWQLLTRGGDQQKKSNDGLS
ncbi:MAG: murein biosynthesis integral membrane protein MurJ [Planctomycetaceae bacterium]